MKVTQIKTENGLYPNGLWQTVDGVGVAKTPRAARHIARHVVYEQSRKEAAMRLLAAGFVYSYGVWVK